MQVKKFSQACENNKNPIFAILEAQLKKISHVLEIGSGTGQHAVSFTKRLPHLTWQATDQGEYFTPLKIFIEKQDSASLSPPLLLDVSQAVWPISDCELIFTANTLHIMPWAYVEKLFKGIQRSLQVGGHFYIYGPFNDGGKYSSSSNEAFAMRLKNNNPSSGIRDIEKIMALAENAELGLFADHSMPANNRLLHFIKK